MGVATLLRKLGTEHGIEIEDAELAELGLSEEEEHQDAPPDDVLSVPLPGEASGAVELFLGGASTSTVDGQERDGLMWYPIIREGQWAVRPGATGTKRKVPLKVIPGSSKNQRREIGLKDLLDAFNDKAIEYVTVPSSHNNTTLENQGFIRAMKIVDGTVKDRKTNKDVKVKVLMGGYDFTEPDTKSKVERGTVASRSAGILYDYVNTETGKTYPVVIEHVALTNKPWITGMQSFGRKLNASQELETVALSLSDDEPAVEEVVEALSIEASDDSDPDFLAQGEEIWSDVGSLQWVQSEADKALSALREQHRLAMRAQLPDNSWLDVGDRFPYWNVRNVVAASQAAGKILVSDGWGNAAVEWVVPYTIKDNELQLQSITDWKKVRTVKVEDEAGPSAEEEQTGSAGSDAKDTPTGVKASDLPADDPRGRIKLAQQARRKRAGSESSSKETTTTHPRGGEHMAGEEQNGALVLSEDAQRVIQEAEARARAAEERAESLSQQVTRMSGSVQKREVDDYIAELKNANFDEEHGFGGVLVEIRELMLADDGEPAVQGEHFAQDGNTTGELTLSDAIKRIFGAFKRTEEGKLALGEALSQPSDGGEKKDKTDDTEIKPKEGETDLGDDGKPKATDGENEGDKTPEQLADELVTEDPIIAERLGIGAAASAGSTDKGGDA